MARRVHGNGSDRPFGCMPNTEVMPCGHCPPKKHKARGMCHTCYKKWLIKTGRSSYTSSWRRSHRRDPPVNRIALPRGDRIETWVWDHDYMEIGNECDVLFMRRARELWVVELGGDKVTGAYGPLESPRQCTWAVKGDRIIRNEAVIEVMEARRDEFKRLAA